MLKKALFLLVTLSVALQIRSQKIDPPFLKYLNHPWVDSVYKSLSEDERIAQLIWIAGFAGGDIAHEDWLIRQIREYSVGGIIFFKGDPVRQSELINHFRNISKVPPIIATDGEYGLGMRLDGVEKFPNQLTLGAIRNDSLIYFMGRSIAGQFRRAGADINLAPVADINNNPLNPVINARSFGEDPENVASKSLMYMKGLQDGGIIAVAKHFPGHGDTEIDSHFDLPVLKHTEARLDSVELIPFRRLIEEGVSGVMPGHLNIIAIDSSTNLPSTLSHKVLSGLLRDRMGFNGLILSDAMNMGGVTKYAPKGEAEPKALAAGIDVLEYVTDPANALKQIKEDIKKGKIKVADIEKKCKLVLSAKYFAGLNKKDSVDITGLKEDLSSPEIMSLIRDLFAGSLTLISNEQNLIPIRNLDKIRIANIAVNRSSQSLFQKRSGMYVPADNFFVDPDNSAKTEALIKKLSQYDIIITAIYGFDQRGKGNMSAALSVDRFLKKLPTDKKLITVWFGNPYTISWVESLKSAEGVVVAYQENNYTEDLSAQMIFGAIGAKGSLPVTLNEKWKCGFGILSPGNIRMQYGIPESAGISSLTLNNAFDTIIFKGINARAFPGCEVMVARKGIVILHKTYGFHTYANRTPVAEEDLFDLASVTKVSSTLAGLMYLDSKGKFSTEKELGEYLPYFRRSDKGDLIMSDILTHQAGLTSWIPFWKETVKKNGALRKSIFRKEQSARYTLEVTEKLFIRENYKTEILKKIKNSPLSAEKKYLYSDLGFIIMPEIITNITGIKWTDFLRDTIYRKLGAYDICFNPGKIYPLSRIVPTEYDSLFRKQQLQGTVHDEGAAMLGGISGHAGLFATANDLMKLVEMYRRMGSYGGEEIIRDIILKRYTSVQFPDNNNRRGIGFDKPLLNNNELSQKEAYPARSASPSSFGHSGYTGTFIWVDPENEISFVFLSNRVYPTRNNTLLSDMNIRSDLLQAIYDSIIKENGQTD